MQTTSLVGSTGQDDHDGVQGLLAALRVIEELSDEELGALLA